MLSQEDNELLSRIGPGTMMGDVFRQYWLPALLSTELPEPDGPPLRVRLLGEELVAFRDTTGAAGLLALNCPHRGASLFFGRNEECGLRCVYHGWKFDVSGRCVDMPNEPPESNFKDKVRITAYPCRERNGVIWTYMGPLIQPPDLPDLEWNLVPVAQRYISKRFEACNWAQALEGGIDSSHSSFLHSRLDAGYDDEIRRGFLIKDKDRHPRFETIDTDYGVMIAARRTAGEDQYYWRITQFLMPSYTMIPPYTLGPLNGHCWVPMDDVSTMAWTITWHPARDLTAEELERMQTGWGLHLGLNHLLPPTSEPGGAWRPAANATNDYLIDWDVQKHTAFSGLPGVAMQDSAMQESMGPIFDRTREHLGASDTGIIRVRQRWLRAARALREQGVTPPGAASPRSYRVRAAATVLSKDDRWVEAMAERFEARPGVLLESV